MSRTVTKPAAAERISRTSMPRNDAPRGARLSPDTFLSWESRCARSARGSQTLSTTNIDPNGLGGEIGEADHHGRRHCLACVVNVEDVVSSAGETCANVSIRTSAPQAPLQAGPTATARMAALKCSPAGLSPSKAPLVTDRTGIFLSGSQPD